MASKPTGTFKKYQLINLSLALGFLSSMAMKETTIIYDFVAYALNSIQMSEPASNVLAVCLNWWLPSAVLFALLRFTKRMDWLTQPTDAVGVSDSQYRFNDRNGLFPFIWTAKLFNAGIFRSTLEDRLDDRGSFPDRLYRLISGNQAAFIYP
jgi:hypothetical protein